jgi:hypothetical protein
LVDAGVCNESEYLGPWNAGQTIPASGHPGFVSLVAQSADGRFIISELTVTTHNKEKELPSSTSLQPQTSHQTDH